MSATTYARYRGSGSIRTRADWYAVIGLCKAYNDATNPTVMRTAHAHHRCDQYARAILKRMAKLDIRPGREYRQDQDGRLVWSD